MPTPEPAWAVGWCRLGASGACIRVALMALLMIPLVVGRDGDEEDKPDTGEEADADADADVPDCFAFVMTLGD